MTKYGLTIEKLEEQIASVDYATFGETGIHCTITLVNGYTVTGESSCIDPTIFNEDIGKKIAYKNAFDKLWFLLRYNEKQRWYEETQLTTLAEAKTALATTHDIENNEGGFDFSCALQLLVKGIKVSRSGWNGADQFVYYVPENTYPASQNENSPIAGVFKDDMVPYRAYLALKTIQGDVATWAPSISDVLAVDWFVVK